MSSNGYVE